MLMITYTSRDARIVFRLLLLHCLAHLVMPHAAFYYYFMLSDCSLRTLICISIRHVASVMLAVRVVIMVQLL